MKQQVADKSRPICSGLSGDKPKSLRHGLLRGRAATYSLMLGGFCIAGIGLFDWWTGANVSLAILYLLPVSGVAWFTGNARFSTLLALGASVFWFVADYVLHDSSYLLVSVWNAITGFVIFGGMGTLMAILRKEHEQLCLSLDRLAELAEVEATAARTDSLTGLCNGRAFYEALEREWSKYLRQGHPLSLAFIDIDNFKQINDRYGHEKGDELLAKFARQLADSTRKDDVIGRLGGDEFALLLPRCAIEEARVILERVTQGVAALSKEYPGTGLGLSIGLVSADKQMQSSKELLKKADVAMYRVKDSGKGGVAIDYGPLGTLTVKRSMESDLDVSSAKTPSSAAAPIEKEIAK